jgi:hypothetical protein
LLNKKRHNLKDDMKKVKRVTICLGCNISDKKKNLHRKKKRNTSKAEEKGKITRGTH